MPRLPSTYVEFIGGLGSPRESFSRDSIKTVRYLDVEWSDRWYQVKAICGFPLAVDPGDGGFWKLSRFLPERHPEMPDLVATSVASIKAVGLTPGAPVKIDTADGSIANYTSARLEVEYERPKYFVKEDSEVAFTSEYDRFTSYETRAGGDYLSLPLGSLKWAQGPAAGTPYPAGSGVIVPTIDYVWTWRQIPVDYVNQSDYTRLIGRVNNSTFAGKSRHTLLLTGVEFTYVFSPTGALCYDIQYTVRFNKFAWTRFLYWQDGQYYLATRSGTNYSLADGGSAIPDGEAMYDESSYGLLFTLKLTGT